MTSRPHPSSTVVVVRDVGSAASGLEILYLRRNANLSFHGGAWVFPGGRIDPEDTEAAGGDPDAASRCAAAREVEEEAGLTIRPGELVAISRWTTPEPMPKRFETDFFVCASAGGDVRVDGSEIHEHRWLAPAAALAAQRAGEIFLPPPTFVTTTRLSAYAGVDALVEACRRAPVEVFLPRIHSLEDGACSLYGEDEGYADGNLDREGPRHRLWMRESGWRYERAI